MTFNINGRKMKELMAKRLQVYREKSVRFYGLIGNPSTGAVAIPGRTNMIYVTSMNGIISEVLNRRVPSVFASPVQYGYDSEDMPNTLQVLSSWDVYFNDTMSNSSSHDTPYHHESHEWPHGDTTWTLGEQFIPSLAVPGTGLAVRVYPGNYFISTGWLAVSVVTTIDLSAVSPALTTNQCRMVMIVVDSTGAFTTRVGAIVTGWNNLSYDDIPTPAIGDNCICAVKCFYGQTTFRKDGNNNDFVDLRFTGVSSGSSVSGLPVGTNTGDFIRFNATSGLWEVKAEPVALKGIVLTPALASLIDAEGAIYYNSSTKSVMVCTSV